MGAGLLKVCKVEEDPAHPSLLKPREQLRLEVLMVTVIGRALLLALHLYRATPLLVLSTLVQRWHRKRSVEGVLSGLRIKAWIIYGAVALKFVLNERRTKPRNISWIYPVIELRQFAEYMLGGRSNDIYGVFFKRLGPTFAVWAPGLGNVVMTADPKNVQHILKNNFDNYVKGPETHDRLKELLGNGIFNADGELWYHQRKSASPLFTTNNFKDHMTTTFVRGAEGLAELLSGPAQRLEVVDMFNLFNRFTLDAIGEVGFGRNIGAMENPHNPVLASFDAAQQGVMERFILRAITWRVERVLGSASEVAGREHFATLDAYVRGIAREAWASSFDEIPAQSRLTTPFDDGTQQASPTPERRKRGSKGEGMRSDFLSLFIAQMKATGCSSTASSFSKKDEDFLRDLIMNFLIAGRDTTAQALSWTFFLLSQHPEVEARLHSEIVEVCGDGPLTFENTNRLEYTQYVVNEVLRLYPSVPKNLKVTVANDVLPDGTIMPAGCLISHVPYQMGRSTAIWGDDATEFRPERWVGQPVNDLFKYPAFHAGQRECLGRRMAYLEMKVCLAALLRRYSFKLAVDPSEVTYAESLTLPMSISLPMLATVRS